MAQAVGRHARGVDGGDVGAMQPADELVLDDRPGTDSRLVDDQFARHDATLEPMAPFK